MRFPRAGLFTLVVLAFAAPRVRAATITFAGDRGSSCQTFVGTAGGAHTIAVSGANLTAGQTVILTAGTTGNASLGSVTDPGGNTWTAVNSWAVGGVGRVFQWATTIGTTVSTGANVSLNYVTSADGEVSCASVHAFTNVQSVPGGVDLTGGTNGTSTTPSVTLGSATSQPNELLVETHIVNGVTGGFGSADNPLQAANSGNFWVMPFYRIVSATGTYTVGGTLGNSLAWQAVLTTFRDTTAPVEILRVKAE